MTKITEEMRKKTFDGEIPKRHAFLEVNSLQREKRRIELKENKIFIGRSSKCDIQFPLESISRKHASLYFHNEQYFIKDLESTNGIYLNGVKIEKASLKDGDYIELGEIKMFFIEN